MLSGYLTVLPPEAAWALGVIVKATVVLAVAALLTTALRRASAAARHLVWGGALATALLLPLLSLSVPWRLPIAVIPAVEPTPIPSSMLSAPAVAPAHPSTGAKAHAPRTTVALPPVATEASPSSSLSSIGIVVLVWGAGALLLLLQLVLGGVVLRRVVRRAEPLESREWTEPLADLGSRLALPRLPRLVMASRLPMPFACGFLRPSIVLPRRAAQWDQRRRRAVLCHELAHLRRSDLVMNAVGQLALAAYWFHPLAWVALRRLRVESERACDDLVLGTGTRPSEYADHLLQIVSAARRQATPAIALPLAHHREFEGRVLAILSRGLRRDAPSRVRATILGMIGLGLVVPLAAVAPVRAAHSAPPVQRSATPSVPSKIAMPATSAAAARPVPAPRPAPSPAPDLVQETPASGDTAKSAVVASLLQALHDAVSDVRKNAAYALGHLESAAAAPALGRSLVTDADPDVREMAGWSLGEIQDSSSVAALGTALRADTAESVRLIAAWALGEIGSARGVPLLTAALGDRSAEVRERAIWALGTIQSSPAPAALMDALRDPAPEVRAEAAWAIGQIADLRAAAALGGAIADSDVSVRKAVIWALGEIGGDSSQAVLVRALKDRDPALRAQAARALGGNEADPWPQPRPIVR